MLRAPFAVGLPTLELLTKILRDILDNFIHKLGKAWEGRVLWSFDRESNLCGPNF